MCQADCVLKFDSQFLIYKMCFYPVLHTTFIRLLDRDNRSKTIIGIHPIPPQFSKDSSKINARVSYRGGWKDGHTANPHNLKTL